jgi:hypothetical protein
MRELATTRTQNNSQTTRAPNTAPREKTTTRAPNTAAPREKTTTRAQDTATREKTTTRAQDAANRLNHEIERREAEKRQRVEQDVGLFGGRGPLYGRPNDDEQVLDYILTLSEKRRRIGRGTVVPDHETLCMQSDEENMDPGDESTSPTDLWKNSRLQLTTIKDMTRVTSGPQVFGSSSSLTRRESRSSSSDTRLGRVNFRLRDMSGPRQKAQWKRLIHAVTLDYIQHGPESGDLEDDQRDILKIIQARFQIIVGETSELTPEQLRSVRFFYVFLTGRYSNGLYGHGDNG